MALRKIGNIFDLLADEAEEDQACWLESEEEESHAMGQHSSRKGIYISYSSTDNELADASSSENDQSWTLVTGAHPERIKALGVEGYMTVYPEADCLNVEHGSIPRYVTSAVSVQPQRDFGQDFSTMLCYSNPNVGSMPSTTKNFTNDIIIGAISPLLKAWDVTATFEACESPMTARAVTSSVPILTNNETEPKLYTISQQGSVGHTMPLKLAFTKSLGKGWRKQVLIRLSGEWHEFKPWLDNLPRARLPDWQLNLCSVGSHGYDRQAKWWRMNGGTFRITELPAEIRIEIYKLYIGHGSKLFHKDRLERHKFVALYGSHTTLSERPYYCICPLEHDICTGISTDTFVNLFLVCKSLYKDARIVVWENTWLSFYDGSDLGGFGLRTVPGVRERTFLPRLVNTLGLSVLRKLELFLQREMLEYFFINFRIDSTATGASILSAPSILSGLEQLNLVLPYNRVRCQQLWVDWILTCAFHYIKHFPKVSLAGYIKRSTREIWEANFAAKEILKTQFIALPALTSDPTVKDYLSV